MTDVRVRVRVCVLCGSWCGWVAGWERVRGWLVGWSCAGRGVCLRVLSCLPWVETLRTVSGARAKKGPPPPNAPPPSPPHGIDHGTPTLRFHRLSGACSIAAALGACVTLRLVRTRTSLVWQQRAVARVYAPRGAALGTPGVDGGASARPRQQLLPPLPLDDLPPSSHLCQLVLRHSDQR